MSTSSALSLSPCPSKPNQVMVMITGSYLRGEEPSVNVHTFQLGTLETMKTWHKTLGSEHSFDWKTWTTKGTVCTEWGRSSLCVVRLAFQPDYTLDVRSKPMADWTSLERVQTVTMPFVALDTSQTDPENVHAKEVFMFQCAREKVLRETLKTRQKELQLEDYQEEAAVMNDPDEICDTSSAELSLYDLRSCEKAKCIDSVHLHRT